MATAGTPPSISPSTNRPDSSSAALGASGTTSPRTVAAVMEIVMAWTRPIRSARADHGITPNARPTVAAEIVSAA